MVVAGLGLVATPVVARFRFVGGAAVVAGLGLVPAVVVVRVMGGRVVVTVPPALPGAVVHLDREPHAATIIPGVMVPRVVVSPTVGGDGRGGPVVARVVVLR